MDPLYLAIAFVPLAVYLIGLALVHLRSRPTVWSGVMDNSLLAFAVAGLIVAGPMDLFMPESSPMPGIYLWLLMLALYVLVVTLWNLLARPRLVVSNVSVEHLQATLGELAPRLDAEATATGESYLLPQLGVQFHIERYLPLHNVSLVAIGDHQSVTGWKRLQAELRTALAGAGRASRVPAYGFFAVGMFMLAWSLSRAAEEGQIKLRQQLSELLRVPPAARDARD